MSTAVNYQPFLASDICIPVQLDIKQDDFSVDKSWIAGAFFLGLFLGALLTALCVPFCLRDLAKKKRQEDEEAMIRDLDSQNASTAKQIRQEEMVIATAISNKRKGSAKPKKTVTKRETEEEVIDVYGDPKRITILQPADGLGKVMVNFSSEGAEEEMSKQDLQKVDKMAADLQKEKDEVLFKMLKKRLKKLNLAGNAMATILRNIQEDLLNKRKMYENEQKEEEQILKQHHAKDKDSSTLDDELERLDARTNQKLAHLHEEERDFIRNELSKNSGLSEKEIEALMEKLLGDMSKVDKRHADEVARQRRALEERLARRRQIIEMRKLQDNQEKEEILQNAESQEDVLKQLVNDSKLKEKQKNQILNEYMQDMKRLTKARDVESQRQQLALEEKLARRRQKEIQKLQQEQLQEKAIFLENVDKSTEIKGVVEGYMDLNEKHRLEMEHKELNLDQEELQSLDKMRTEAAEMKKREIERKNEEMVDIITNVVGQENKYDVDKLIKLHKKKMAQYEEDRLEERNKMAAKLRERLNQRMMKLDTEEEATQQEQDVLMAQQTSTVSKVLNSSIELTDEAKEKILKEHEHNMRVINNQLQCSRLKQQKNLENKLNQRKAKMAEIRRQKEETLMNKAKANLEEIEKYQQQLEAELQLEEKRLEDEKKAALMALRRRLAAETEEALSNQEKQLGQLIGRLEVGAARRRAILEKQDATLENLQAKLENQFTKEGRQLTGVDIIIQQHSSQVEQLNDTLQRARDNQEKIIKEKIQAKKYEKELELKEELAEDKVLTRKNSSLRRRGAGRASDILSLNFMEQRHKKQREELENEMKVEMERSKEELNQQLELELQTELENQRRDLLNQLTAASGMSRSEIMTAVDSAVKDTGGDQKTAKKLAKELKQGVERARTDLSMDYGMDEDFLASRNSMDITQQGYGRPSSALGELKPRGKKKKIAKSSVAPEPIEGWRGADYDDEELL